MHKTPARTELVMAKMTSDADDLLDVNDKLAEDALREPKVTVEVERNCTVEVEEDGDEPVEEEEDDAAAASDEADDAESERLETSAAAAVSAELEEE